MYCTVCLNVMHVGWKGGMETPTGAAELGSNGGHVHNTCMHAVCIKGLLSVELCFWLVCVALAINLRYWGPSRIVLRFDTFCSSYMLCLSLLNPKICLLNWMMRYWDRLKTMICLNNFLLKRPSKCRKWRFRALEIQTFSGEPAPGPP